MMKTSAYLTAFAVLIGAMASAASTSIGWVRAMYVLAAFLSLAALFLQFQSSKPFVLPINDDDWKPNGDRGKSIIISARRHRKGKNATGRLEQRDQNGDWETVFGDSTTLQNGDVVTSIAAGSQLVGRIVIY